MNISSFFSRFSYLINVKLKTGISGNSSNFLGNFPTFSLDIISQQLWYWKLYSWEGCFQFPFSWFHCLSNVKLKTETFFLYKKKYVPFFSITFLYRKTDLISSIKTFMEFERLAEDERIFNLFCFRDHFLCLVQFSAFSSLCWPYLLRWKQEPIPSLFHEKESGPWNLKDL